MSFGALALPGRKLLATVWLVLVASMAHAASGVLDPAFGAGGIARDQTTEWWAVALQPDGRIVAAGSGYPADFKVGRYQANGAPDATFGPGGTVITPMGNGVSLANALAVQSNGKIVVAGEAQVGLADWDFAIARYNTDGTLDTTFGTGGRVITSFGALTDRATAIAVQADGKIVVAGHASVPSAEFALARYNADGTLDAAFGTGGKLTTPMGDAASFPNALAIQPDGRIVVAGVASASANEDFALVRYHANGSLDATFGSGGKVMTPIGSGANRAHGLALQADAKIVAVGYSTGGFALARYLPDGSLDPAFGAGGTVSTAFGPGEAWANSVAIGPNGIIAVAGGFLSGGSFEYDFAVARYAADGSLDATFGSGGKVTTVIGIYDIAHALAFQPDGAIVVAGTGAITRYVDSSWPARVSDANGDGRSDVIWRDSSAGFDYLWQMNGLAVSSQGYLPGVPTSWSVAGIGDASGDGKADLLWREAGGLNYLWILDGFSVTSGGYLPTVPASWTIAGLGDATGDGKADVFWRNPATGQNYLWAMDGLSIASQGYFPDVPGTDWEIAGIADFSGDSKADVLWRNKVTGLNYLWMVDGLSVASQGYLPTVPGTDWEVAGTPDADGNGTADVLWRNKASGENYLWLMNGLTVSGQGYLPGVDPGWKIVGHGDYNGDGRGDVLWRNAGTGANYLWTLNGIAVASNGYLPSVAGANWQPVKR